MCAQNFNIGKFRLLLEKKLLQISLCNHRAGIFKETGDFAWNVVEDFSKFHFVFFMAFFSLAFRHLTVLQMLEFYEFPEMVFQFQLSVFYF